MRETMKNLMTGLVLVASCGAGLALGGGDMRCGTHLVEQGMSKKEVERLCGAPDAVEQQGAVWVYDPSPNEMLRVITFVAEEVQFVNEEPRATYPGFEQN